MIAGNTYYTLLSSLPPLPARFDVERLPITPARLEERLRMLEKEDAEVVSQLQDFLISDRHRQDWSDEDVVVQYDRLMERTSNGVAREIVEFRMDTRTVLSGLRRRRRGLGPPPGVGQWTGHIQRHWQQRDFALGWRFAWVEEIDRLLEEDRVLEIHRILLGHAWQHWRNLSEEHFFDFEALLLYLARWEVIARWTSLDFQRGSQQFETIIREATDEHRDLFE
jgi:hypothetical protein